MRGRIQMSTDQVCVGGGGSQWAKLARRYGEGEVGRVKLVSGRRGLRYERRRAHGQSRSPSEPQHVYCGMYVNGSAFLDVVRKKGDNF